MRVPQNGWYVMENLIKMDDLGVPLFSETPIWFIQNKGISKDHWGGLFPVKGTFHDLINFVMMIVVLMKPLCVPQYFRHFFTEIGETWK